MTLYNRYVATLAVLFTSTTVVLAVYNQQRLDLYFSLYLIEYLASTLLFVYLKPRARRLLNMMGYVLFGGFTVVVAMRMGQILGLPGLR
ncbi:MAG: hypothetical protein Q8P22_00765 [Chloroflexota bacterium]|nr:hypothetical protein [Chloroflexota bacterium]